MTIVDLLLANWSTLALAIISALSTFTALTESTKDDKILDVVKRIIQAIVMGTTKRRRAEKKA
jgi:hypothetical protein